jgi:hypothetical protein
MTWRDDSGQALVVVALATTALFAMAAIAVDWGLALAQRRTLVTAADSGAMAAARYLVRYVVLENGQIALNTSREKVYCEVSRFATADRTFLASAQTIDVKLEFGNGTSWTAPLGGIACPPTASTAIPSDTVYVRLTLSAPGERVLGTDLGAVGSIGGTAVVRLTGSTFANGPVIPFIREYDRAFFDCGSACAPDSLVPRTLWAPNDDDVSQQSYKGMLDLSRDSTRVQDQGQPVPQLLTGWDRTGSPPTSPLHTDYSGKCGGSGWDTAGGESPQTENKRCSGTNFLRYGFGGELSLLTDHSTAPASIRPVGLSGGRSVCVDPLKPQVTPSCGPGNGYLGDWVETALGGVGGAAVDAVKAQVTARGTTTSLSAVPVVSGPFRGQLHGKGLPLALYLWDCAERYQGGTWQLITAANGDCSTVLGPGDPAPDRVHLFTVVPFTVYEGLIGNNLIQGYVGGLMGDATACRDCPLDPFVNSAHLVNP